MKKIYKILAFSLIILSGWNTRSFAQFYTFSYTGGVQSYTVPPGIFTIQTHAEGATGGLNSDPIGHVDLGGAGACVWATFAVTPGQVITVNVGGKGGDGAISVGGLGGFNGGGDGGAIAGSYAGGGGGGASDIRFGLTRMLIAAGGGGAGAECGGGHDAGGFGGGTTGGTGGHSCTPPPITTGGGGGTVGAGGGGGTCVPCLGISGFSGLAYQGGAGGTGSPGGGGGGGLWGGGGGQYTGGGGGSSYIDVSGTAPARTDGCNSGGNGSVTITAICTPGTVVATASVICVANTLTVSDAVSGGTWSSGNTAVATADPTTGIVTGVSGGTAVITYNIGPCFAMKTITVNPLPTTIPDFAICVASSVTLSDGISGGTWASTNTAVATVDGTLGTVTGVSSGTATISYTLGTGCYTTINVTVNPLPSAITGPDTVCLGLTTSLSDGGGGTWLSSNTSIATISGTGVVTGVLDGNIYYNIYTTDGLSDGNDSHS